MTGRRLKPKPVAPFASHRGRRCRHGSRSGSFTGWSAVAALPPVASVADDFTQPRTTRPTIHPYERTPR